MRIDRLTIRNFNGFDLREFHFDPHFNLVVGDNGTGKTTVLDALSVAIGSWFLGIRGYAQAVGIDQDEVRVIAYPHTDRFTFEKQFPARIEATGQVLGRSLDWAREMGREGGRTTTGEAKALFEAAKQAEQAVQAGTGITLPLLCSFGTERLWFETQHKKSNRKEINSRSKPSRLDGYVDCLYFEIQESALLDWIRDEVSVSEQLRKETIALRVVRSAITNCLEGATHLYYDHRYKDIVINIGQYGAQLFRNLSDGQRIMLTLVGDLARRATILNPQLEERALVETPGVVLIDELDLHLHPKWQRNVIHDLKKSFPSVQFIVTSHSPQLIGEARPNEIRLLDDNRVSEPTRSFGIDSSRILAEVMHASPRDVGVGDLLSKLSILIDKEEFDDARKVLEELETKLGSEDPEIARAHSMMTFLESTR